LGLREGGAGGRRRDARQVSQAPTDDRILLRPSGLALHAREPAAAVICCLILGIIFLAEIVTPSTVVASLALVPLIGAGWLFSRRAASGVAIVAAALFTLSLVAEARNRPTLIIVGVVTVVVVAGARLYAARLVSLMAQPENPAARNDRVASDFFDRLPRGIDSLTRREVDVARLAAEGRRAAEISADLRISERTVESHLASIYSKLGINSKAKLVWMASALPADSPVARHR
jgi:DNA-binding CsgD family transcriptional regulator